MPWRSPARTPWPARTWATRCLHQGKYAEAEVQFRKVLAMDAEHYRQTPPELAQALAGQGRIGEAIAFVHETIPEKSEKAKAMNDLATVPGTASRPRVPRRSNCCKRQSNSPPSNRWG